MINFARSCRLSVVIVLSLACCIGAVVGTAQAQGTLREVPLGEAFTIDVAGGEQGVSVSPSDVGALVLVDANGEPVVARWDYLDITRQDAADAPAQPDVPIAIYPPLGDGTSNPAYTLRFDAEPFFEPNDDFETAQEISPGEVVDLRLMPRWDR
ncbi:MAG: hypothetical protein ACSHW1_06895, partial [Yoonia sp.]|uniref:hypothetical protein n=1 Tax=Yoonia sp. TaxID=2212373 RepID=UPI003EF670F0